MVAQAVQRVYFRAAARMAWRSLRRLSGPALLDEADRAAVRAFRRAARRVPAYRRLLADRGIDAGAVTDAESFRRLVPLTDKQSVFADNDLPSLCLDGSLRDLASVYTSSGHSGVFSFGLETHKDGRRGRASLDLLLEMYLATSSRRTLLVNALPMGVRVPVGLPIVLDTGTRADAVLAVIHKLGGFCEQVLIVGEPAFLKKVVEDGLEAGLDWPRYRVSMLTGAEVVSENFRSYLGPILGNHPTDRQRGRIVLNAGISEIGLSVGHETDACWRIRREALSDAALRTALFGQAPFLPTFLQYFPQAFYMETPESQDGTRRLVVTTCNPGRRVPLIRYATGDWAQAFTHEEVCRALEACGREDLRPEFELPFLAIWGRGGCLDLGGRKVFPEQIKEALYSNPSVASVLTAAFHMTDRDGRLHVDCQLKPNAVATEAARSDLGQAINEWTGLPAEVNLVPYRQFPDTLEMCYQRKFKYL